MSEFKVEVVKVGPLEKHPNADTLSITKVFDYPVIVKTGDIQEGDLAFYIPVDAVVPTDRPDFAFLAGDNEKKTVRIKAKKLRGVFSMGLLIKANADAAYGGDWAPVLGITKYEEPEKFVHGEAEKDPGIMPKYTDIENYRKYGRLLEPGEDVIITEKIHGANGRWLWDGERHWAGSHHMIKKQGQGMWWDVAAPFLEKLKGAPGVVFYGEVYGQVQDLRYGIDKKENNTVRFFDAFDIGLGRYMDWPDFIDLCLKLDLPVVPTVYWGSFDPEIVPKAAEADSMLCPGQLREGVVIRPTKERWDHRVGRVILKYHSERYLTRKGGTEGH